MNVKAMEQNRSSRLLAFAGLLLALLLSIAATFFPGAAMSAPKIVVLGDSLSAGYGLAPGKAFPDQLQQALSKNGVDVEVIGAGVSGDTTSGGLSRLDWSVPKDTSAVILELGANDALRGLPPEKAKANLDEIVRRLKLRNVDVLLTGMLAPPNMGKAYGDKFNMIYPDLAKKYSVPLYPFFLDGVAAQADLTLPDGIHPTAEGIGIIVKRILPTVKTLIANMPKPAS